MWIFWCGVLAGCIKCVLTIIKFTVWHTDISAGRLIDWSYQIWVSGWSPPCPHLGGCWTGLSTGATCSELEWVRIQGSQLAPGIMFKQTNNRPDCGTEISDEIQIALHWIKEAKPNLLGQLLPFCWDFLFYPHRAFPCWLPNMGHVRCNPVAKLFSIRYLCCSPEI